jgi:hypothetical protein
MDFARSFEAFIIRFQSAGHNTPQNLRLYQEQTLQSVILSSSFHTKQIVQTEFKLSHTEVHSE